ncbi:hypothetical protein HOLleu_26959 [Holothuria leucospilota]|uniref:PH domain-containing protein n=1 Tax=Holothuria leucospilota TaxID=206669 RepID=A0A9Q1BPA9_HOLLE|nr:hypothetical protein HOLleu_26959 [Holothuria leucospilota]
MHACVYRTVLSYRNQKMADAESVVDSGGTSSSSSSECRCNSNSEGSHCDTDDFDLRKSGWLMKRSVYSKKWKKKWFSLNGTELVYGEDAEVISLE